MNRGAAHRRVFFTRSDGECFEGLLADGGIRFGVEIHAYCLMSNHYHLLLHCPDGGLSGFMQQIGSSYTRWLNTRLQTDGPIFRARFHSVPVRSDAHLARARDYIHANPLAIDTVLDPCDYRWSSARHYARRSAPPPWLCTSRLADDGVVHSDVGGSTTVEVLVGLLSVLVDERFVGLPHRRRGLVRALAVVASDHLEGDARRSLDDWLSLPSDDARRSAQRRARRRLDEHPELAGAVELAVAIVEGGHPGRLVSSGV